MKILKNKLWILLIPLLSLFIISISNDNNVSANVDQTHKKYVTKHAKWADTLNIKATHILSLLYGNHDYMLTNISKKHYNKIVKDKVKFKVRDIGVYKNGISFNLVSRGNKYNTWSSYPIDFYYTNSRSKELKPIVKLARNIYFNKGSNKKYKILYNMINKIKNKKDKSIAKSSYYQLKKYKASGNSSLKDVPYILIGNF